jgi:hypothetical protein
VVFSRLLVALHLYMLRTRARTVAQHAEHARADHSFPYPLYIRIFHDAYIRKTAVLLLTPSKIHVLSTGTYCSVMTLMTSCETIPPESAAILCSSAPPARTTSCTASPICVLTAAYSSSSIEAFASFTRSSAILKAMLVTFSVYFGRAA